MSFKEQIIQAIKDSMPPNAEIRVSDDIHNFIVGISWKIEDDSKRLYKMSKTILICVSYEAAQAFASVSAADQGAAYKRVTSFLSSKLATFDPNHNAPRNEAPPVEQWVISSNVVLG
jgi:hypothetical protein